MSTAPVTAGAAHVVVVGGGIVGASISWHLAALGARVTVVEAGQPGGVATPRSFAWINASWGNPERYFRLRIRAMAEWRRLAADVPGLEVAWTGGLLWDLPPAELASYALEHAQWGYGIRRVDHAEAARLEPGLADPPDLAVHVAEEGAVEPRVAALALIEDARRRGARIVPGTAVTGLVETNARVVGIETPAGRIAADHVVVAAGAGAATLVRTVGVDLPLTTPPGLLVHSAPCARRLNGLVMAPEAHLRQSAEGRVVAGADFAGDDPGGDPEGTARALFARVKGLLKDAGDLDYAFHTVGYRPTPADGFPVVGRVAGRDGLYLAVMHSGITLAPAIGLFCAQDLLDDRRDPLLAPYALGRFAGA